MDTITVVSDYMDTNMVSPDIFIMLVDYQNMLEFKYIDEFNQ